MMPSIIQNRAVWGLLIVALITNATSTFGGLLANYKFESTSGTPPTETTPDSSGNGKHATLIGGATPGTNYPTITTANGPDGSNSMQFFGGTTSGTGSRISVDAADVDLNVAFPEFTFATWLMPDATTTRDRYVAGKMGGSGQRGWHMLRLANSNSLSIDYFDGPSGAEKNITVENVFTDNVWTHLAFVFKGGVAADIYVNGTLKFNTTDVLTMLNGANTAPFQIGNRGAFTSASWTGWMDDARVYNNALTAAEVAALATVNQPVAGDFDGDADVDGADFIIWQTNHPTLTGANLANGDADNDDDVDGADFAIWQGAFPNGPSPSVTPIPEPHSLLLLVLGGIAIFASYRERN